jgi:iron(III) transport system ATP-binding protein
VSHQSDTSNGSGVSDVSGLVVEGLTKSFGQHVVLHGVDLAIGGGSLVAVLGPSGSGKTTLLRVVAGFERADAGSVTIGRQVVDEGSRYVAPEHRGIGYVPQEVSLFPHLTVAKNVGFGVPRGARRKERVDALLEMVGLAGMGRRYPHQLSGGQQQRVALARALAIGPAIVLLDEPFSSLDAGMRAHVRADVRDVLRRAGTTAVLVTHDQDEALSWADQVAVIRDGRIGQCAAPQELYARPADPGLATFVGEANLVPGELDGERVTTRLGVLALAPDAGGTGARRTPAVVLVRPEQLELSGDLGGTGLSGRVVAYQYFGHDAVVRVQPEDSEVGTLVVRITGGRTWAPGARVGLHVRGPVLAWASPAAAAVAPELAGTEAWREVEGARGTGGGPGEDHTRVTQA